MLPLSSIPRVLYYELHRREHVRWKIIGGISKQPAGGDGVEVGFRVRIHYRKKMKCAL